MGDVGGGVGDGDRPGGVPGDRGRDGVDGGVRDPSVGPPVVPVERTGPTPALIALVAAAVVVLGVGLIVWLANRGGDDIASAPVTLPPAIVTSTTPNTSSPATTSTTSTSTTTTTSSTTTSTSSTSSTTTSTTSTTTSTTPPTTTPPAFALPEPGAPSWTVALQTGQQATLALAATSGEVRIYDGVVGDLRCVGVVGPGEDLTAWCGPPDAATTLVADRSLEPLIVDLAPETGTVTVTSAPAAWTSAANGCSVPFATILAAVDPGAHAVTDLICAGDEAFVGVGSALFGPNLAPDGGGILVGAGDEGWNPIGGFGTSIDCAGWPDGVDRCALFDVESELFEALLPVPSPGVLGESALQVVDVTDVTADVEAWIGDATDPDEVASIVEAELVDPDAEVPATVRRSGPIRFGTVELVLVEIPQLDDAFRFETWAVWTGHTETNSGVVGAFRWATCTRGVTGDGLCV